MNSSRVSRGSVPDQDLDDDVLGNDVGMSTGTIPEFSVGGRWEVGKRLMTEENYLEVRELAMNRLRQKRVVSAFVLEKVEEMKLQSSSTVDTEKIDAIRAPWSDVFSQFGSGLLCIV